MSDDNEPMPDQQQWERDTELYKVERKNASDAYRDAEKTYDQYLLTLTSGALGLSMTFAKELSHKPPINPGLLYCAWVAFGASLCCLLINLRIVPGFHWQFLEIMDKQFAPPDYQPQNDNWVAIHLKQSAVQYDLGAKLTAGLWSKKVGFEKLMDELNRISFITFLVGLVLLAVFIGRNF